MVQEAQCSEGKGGRSERFPIAEKVMEKHWTMK